MTTNVNITDPGKKRRKGKGCLIAALILVAVLAISGGIGWWYISREHREARNLPLDGADFSKLQDGVYHGRYEGGMYRWRVNECDVTIVDGKVTDIQLTASIDPAAENADAELLYARVIDAQSLQVDTISSATLTGKAYLKAVENALIQAQVD